MGRPHQRAPARQRELRDLAERQRQWATQETPDLDASAFTRVGLNGAEVFYLATYALAGPDGDMEAAATRLRAFTMDDIRTWVDLSALHLERAVLRAAHLERAVLDQAHLEGASLDQAHLEGASLDQAHLEGAVLRAAHLEGASLRAAHLERADLREVFFDVSTSLREVTITDAKHGGARMADVRWQGVNLAIVQAWPDDLVLGDERAARELVTAPLTRSRSDREPLPKDASREDRRQAERQRRDNLLAAWRGATRANRQLSTTMRDQGMNDEADRLSYRGQLCQRELLRLQGKRGRAWLSRFLDLIAGYGYLPQRSFYAYLLVILGFASAYFALGQALGPRLTPFGALVFSMTSFHGRGFFPGGLILDNPLTGLAAFEALFGLIIEVSFIATFTQRFFGK